MPLGTLPFLSRILVSFLLSSWARVSLQQDTEIRDQALRRLCHGLPLLPLLRLPSPLLEGLRKVAGKSEGAEEDVGVEPGEEASLGSWQRARVASVQRRWVAERRRLLCALSLPAARSRRSSWPRLHLLFLSRASGGFLWRGGVGWDRRRSLMDVEEPEDVLRCGCRRR